MTKATSLEMAEAIVSLLEGAGLSASLGEAPAVLNPPHVVVWPGGGFETFTDLGHPIGDMILSIQLTCVGASPQQAQWAADKARAAVSRVTIAPISDYSFWPIYAEQASQPIRKDDQVTPPMYVAVSRWNVRSTPTVTG
jgi:hypothetical protein